MTRGDDEDPDRLADQLDQGADRMQHRSQELGDEVEQVRQDWQRKRADEGVPGAVPPDDADDAAPAEETSGEGNDASERNAGSDGNDESEGNDASERNAGSDANDESDGNDGSPEREGPSGRERDDPSSEREGPSGGEGHDAPAQESG